MTHEEPAQPFDENAALAELERLRQAILSARRERQRKSEEFDAFVQGFRKPVAVPAVERRVARSPEPAAASKTAIASISEPPAADPLPSAAVASGGADVVGTPATASAQGSPRTRARARWPIAVGATVGAIALGVLASRGRKQASPPAATPVTDTRTAPETADAPPPAAQESAAVQDATHAVTLKLRTVRPVWMRVVVDGQKKIEGTVQGGESLQYGGDESIVVRVGNGGDVLVTSGDREAPFGAVDQPVTRRFSKP